MPPRARRQPPRRKQRQSSTPLGALAVALVVLAIALVGGLSRGSSKVVTADTMVLLQPTPDATVDAIVRGRATVVVRADATATPAPRAAATPTPSRSGSATGATRRP